MKAINKRAREVLELLESFAHVSTKGVTIAILKSKYSRPECFANGRINLPECLFDSDMGDILPRTFRHELQHARDVLDGVDLPREEMEVRARKAESMPPVVKVTFVFDTKLMKPACILLQAAMGATIKSDLLCLFPDWLTAPTPGMKGLKVTREEVKELAEILNPRQKTACKV